MIMVMVYLDTAMDCIRNNNHTLASFILTLNIFIKYNDLSYCYSFRKKSEFSFIASFFKNQVPRKFLYENYDATNIFREK